MDGVFDVAIIGSGPGGLQSAIYCGSEGLKTVVVERGKIGGQIADTPKLENFAGQSAKGVSGPSFTKKMREQAASFGVTFLQGDVKELERRVNIVVKGDSDSLKTRSVIIATGATYVVPMIEGLAEAKAKKFIHIGPFNCMKEETPSHPFIVVGGGNSAGQCALQLASVGPVTMVIRHKLKTSLYLAERLKQNRNITILEDAEVEQITRERLDHYCTINVSSTKHWFDAMYICTGNKPNSEAFVCDKDELGFIKTNEKFETNLGGVFAIGDVRSGVARRSVANAIGEASSVTAYLHNYLQNDKAPRSTAD